MTISGTTKIAAVIGYPIEHSLSPHMHNAALAAMGLDMTYVAFKIHPMDLREAVLGLRALRCVGFNVTVPHKETIMPFLGQVDAEASFIGAVNTVVNKTGKLIGYNTDGIGFMRSLEEEGVDAEGKRVLIIGSGGAARAVSWYLCQHAAEVALQSRNPETSRVLVQDLSINYTNALSVADQSTIADYDIVINTTPLGLKEHEERTPVDVSALREGQVVVDLIYRDTPLLQQARARGLKTVNGLGMLLWQGVFALELFTGEEPPVRVMRDALNKAMKG